MTAPKDLLALADELPAWWKCTASVDHRFSVGGAYEVQEYRDGRAVIVTDIPRTRATLPVEGAAFVPHDPWATYRQALRSHQENDNAEG